MEGSAGQVADWENWLAICRRIVAAHERIFAEAGGIEARTEYEGGVGAGGDHSLVSDRRAEEVVFDELARLGEQGSSFIAISEERGSVVFGDRGSPVRVVIDPIDGSLNFRRTIPSHSLSIAVTSGPSMADVEFGFVHDFGADEEFSAVRGSGAFLDRTALEASGPGHGLEVVGIEGSEPGLVAPLVAGLAGKAWRVRAVGSLAITLCYVAAARFDAMIAARPCRSVDVAAAQLIVREAGARVRFGDLGLDGADLGLDARYEIAAALDDESLETVAAVQATSERAT